MRSFNLLMTIPAFCVLAACKKNNGVEPATLVAKWTLVSDYTANHLAQMNYNGVPGDYFDFRADGKCYNKEGNNYDTLSYSITSDTSLNMQSWAMVIDITPARPTRLSCIQPPLPAEALMSPVK